MLQITNLRKHFQTPTGTLEILRGVDLTLAPGESFALTGESGSGKSTLLHLIAGLDRVDGGEIDLSGTAIHTLADRASAQMRRKRIGLVFQQFNLVPSLTVGQNIALQARLAGCHDLDWTTEITGRLGLETLTDRYPEQLSGGQQQRVAIARALAPRPELVLADEPTGNLDEATGDAVIALALDLVAASGAIFLMVTHSPRLAGQMGRQAVLSAGQLA